MIAEETLQQSGYVHTKLGNGVGVHILPTRGSLDGSHSVTALQFWIGAGTSAEGSRQHGCAHMLEHMVFKPIDLRSKSVLAGSDLAMFLESLGGDINAYTDHDETVYYATVPSAYVQQGIQAIADALFQADFAEDQFRCEQEVVIEEIRQYEDDPASRALQSVLSSLYCNHSYGRPVLAEVAEVQAISREGLLRFRDRNYCGQNLNVVVVGSVEPKQVISVVERSLEHLSKAKRTKINESYEPLKAPVVSLDREDISECSWRIAWNGPRFGTKEAVALDVAAVCLGQGDSSRLIQFTRRREQLVSDAYASFHAGVRLGTFLVCGQCKPDQAQAAVLSLLDQVDGLSSKPLRREELQRARAVLCSSLIYNKETVQGMAHTMGFYARQGQPEIQEREYFARLSELTVDDVQQVCRSMLDRKSCVVVGSLPAKRVSRGQANQLKKALVQRLRSHSLTPVASYGRLSHNRYGHVLAKTSSGLQVLADVDRSVPIVGAWLVWPGGQGIEPKQFGGCTALTANLLVRGTEFRSGEIWSEELDSIAATIDGFCGHSTLGLQMECLAENWTEVLGKGLEAALYPRFSEQDFDEERRVFFEDIAAQDDDLASVAYRLMLAKLYRKHPYGRDRKGTPQTLSRIGVSLLRSRWSALYGIDRAILAVCGDVDLEQTMDFAEQYLARYKKSEPASRKLVVPRVEAPLWPRSHIISKIEMKREQAHIVIGYPGLRIDDVRGPILDVLLQILGGQSGRLFLELRENLGLVYDVGVNSIQGRDAGHIAIYAAASQGKFVRARQAIDDVLDSILNHSVSTSELERAKVAILGQFSAGLQRRIKVASSLAIGHLFMPQKFSYLDYPSQIEQVSVRKVKALAKRLFGGACFRVQGIVQAPQSKVGARRTTKSMHR